MTPIEVDKLSRRVRVGVIVWAIDPEGETRYFLRHNKPFHGYLDEWNMIFGSVEPGEELTKAVIREVSEESGLIAKANNVQNLRYSLEYEAQLGPTIIHFFAVKVGSVEDKVSLNEESIGYDWMTITEVRVRTPYPEQTAAYDKLLLTLK